MSPDQAQPVQGCPGKTLRMQGATAAICYGCQRYGAHVAEAIEPRASLDQTSHTWHCPDRVGSFAYSQQVRP